MLNQWTLIGRIGTIETRNGREKSRLYLSVAEDADYFDQTREEWVKRTRWHNLVAWSEIAERITRSYKVGDLVVVEAEVQPWRVEDEGGDGWRSGVNFVVHRIRLLARPKAAEEQ
ncbi:single-stranded DNA-binding protein [Tistrella mobilis]|uniref:single-stranded DNA-binding protein n=1 Tax=Tistrella mobilis TaxID=171437 RepID=UPI0035588292